MSVHKMLGRGLENAILGRDLADSLGVDIRTFCALVEKERREGWPILADCKRGYFLPASAQDGERYLISLQKRTTELTATKLAIQESLRGKTWLNELTSINPTTL